MSSPKHGAVLVVALHLLLVLMGALHLPSPPAHSPFYFLTAYMDYSGASSDYRFFSPTVGSQVRARFLHSDGSGTEREIQLTTPSREVNLRISSMLMSSVNLPEIRDAMAASWAAMILAGQPPGARVSVILEVFHSPSMAEYRRGERGAWRPVYRGDFRAEAGAPAEGSK